MGYVKIITRNKFMDRLKRHLRCHEKEALPWDEETTRALALEPPDGAAREAAPELRGGGDEEVARPGGRDPPDRAADQDRGDPSPGHLHFGQLGHARI